MTNTMLNIFGQLCRWTLAALAVTVALLSTGARADALLPGICKDAVPPTGTICATLVFDVPKTGDIVKGNAGYFAPWPAPPATFQNVVVCTVDVPRGTSVCPTMAELPYAQLLAPKLVAKKGADVFYANQPRHNVIELKKSGTLKADANCDLQQSVNGHNLVPRTSVQFTKTTYYTSFAKCAPPAPAVAPAPTPSPTPTPQPTETGSASAGVHKWTPGHYVSANAFGFPKNDWGRQQTYDLTKQYPQFAGGLVRFAWGQLEQQQGRYDFSQIDKDLAYVKSIGKKLIIEIWWEGYKLESVGQAGDRYFPDYILARSGSVQESGGYYSINLDDPWLMDRFIALCAALAARYDADPAVEMFAINETAHEPGYQWPRAIPLIARQWKQTSVVLYMNWIAHDLPKLVMDTLAANAVGVGAPDTLPPESDGGRYGEDMGSRALRGAGVQPVYQDNPQYGSADFGTTDYRGRIPVAYNFQAIHSIPPSTLIKYQMNTLKVTHSIWAVDHEQTPALNFYDGILPAVQSISFKTVTACPTAYAGCAP
jgi:hypothetical protein